MLLYLSQQSSLPVLKKYKNKLFVWLKVYIWKIYQKYGSTKKIYEKVVCNLRMKELSNQDIRQKNFEAYWNILMAKI